jgi:hypothetical protein
VPEFSDGDAFAAFRSSSMSVKENGGTLKIPVLLSSLSGIATTVDFEITDGTAKAGTHYTLENTSNTLTFTKDDPTQYITLDIIDNDVFGGDVNLTVTLKNPKGVNLGASKTCSVTISDDEHPLAFILGEFSAVGTSIWDDALAWTLTIEKDADDVSKVWISNLVPGGSSLKVYGTVSDDKTEIRIPVGQEIATSSSYPKILLLGYDGETEDDIPTGGYISGTITSDGTITIKDLFASGVFSDDAATDLLGYYNAVLGGSVWTKK